MRRLRATLKAHRPFFVVVGLLTLLTTWPLAQYMAQADGFYLPTHDSADVYVKLWDIWYGGQVLTGKADRFYTDLIYYPAGASLVYHPIFMLHSIAVSALQAVMSLSDAFSLFFLLTIAAAAGSAYIYIHWLLDDKWAALFGAIVFAFSPQVMRQPQWPDIAFIAPLPLVLYCAHRGIADGNRRLILLSGLVAGLTSEIHMYFCIVVLVSLGLLILALAAARWRRRDFWLRIGVLALAVALSCGWRVLPMLESSRALDTAIGYYGEGERWNDLLSFFVNPLSPIIGPIAEALIQYPPTAWISEISYLGFVPLLLLVLGLARRFSRRRALPWLGLLLFFVLLHLGSALTINGVVYESIKLPKHYLDQLLPSIFGAFHRTNHFMPGVGLPLAVLACYGLAALKDRFASAARPRFILGLIGIVVIEYFVPIQMTTVDPITKNSMNEERLAWVEWLKQDATAEKRLIQLPFGRDNAKLYLFYQSLTGYPQTEGAISWTPDYAYETFRANPVFKAWLNQKPASCDTMDRAIYLESVAELSEDGFSHVVHHRGFYFWETVLESFRYVDAAYSDDYVSVYRLEELLASCGD